MNNKRNLILFIVIGIAGVLGHFAYDWSGKNDYIGLFFPISESIWEHLKLLFFPTIIFSAFEYIFIKRKPKNYFFALCISLILGMLTIVTLYYLYTGVLGKNISFIDISLFFVGIAAMLFLKTKIIANKYAPGVLPNIAAIVIIVLFGILFAVYSYNPPHLGIFLPPIPV